MKYSETDLFFAQMYRTERLLRKTRKDLVSIVSVLSPAEKEHLATEFELVRDALRQLIETVRAMPPNPGAPGYRIKAKKEYARIWRAHWVAERERRRAEGDRRVKQRLQAMADFRVQHPKSAWQEAYEAVYGHPPHIPRGHWD